MEKYKIKVENLNDPYEEIAKKVDKIRFENGQRIFQIILDYQDSDEKLFELVSKITNSLKVIVTFEEEVSDDDVIIIGNVNKYTSIITNHNIKILGEFSGNIYSKKKIDVYANSFSNCNIISDDKIIYVVDKTNETISLL